MRQKKINKWFTVLVALVFLVGVIFTVDTVKHPFQGNFYSIIGIERERVETIHIVIMGENIYITESREVEQFLDLFDGNVHRTGTNYFVYGNCDWGIGFVTKDGEEIEIGIRPYIKNSQNPNTSFIFGYYNYSCEKDVSGDYLESLRKK